MSEDRLSEINNRIQTEKRDKILNILTDDKLLNDYLKSKSVKKLTDKLITILKKYNINDTNIVNIVNEYVIHIIPAGLKGVIRGNKFNLIVKNYILNLNLDNNIYIIKFEENHKKYLTSEIPDWYIYNKKIKKIIIGMNQLDLWKGGHQLNRGSKYILEYKNTKECKLLCVIL